MKSLLLSLLVIFIGCKESKKPLVITIDLKERSFMMKTGDSVWVSDYRTVITPNHDGSLFQIRERVPEDTIIKIFGITPTVIIAGNDTTVFWINGDTVRYNMCKPDTVYIHDRYIKHADKVIIGGNEK